MSLRYRLYRFLWNSSLVPQRYRRNLYKRLTRLGEAPDTPFVRDFFGLQYHGNLNNNIDFNIYFYGAFEKPLLYFLRAAKAKLAPEDCVFIDIGANVGQHSLFMAAHGSTVHSFEPFDRVRNQLLGQIAANPQVNIQVHAVGLSNENTRLPFYAPTGNNVGIGSFDAGTTRKGNVAIGELELVRGDDFLNTLNIERIDILKMDVEGFEKPALEGLRETLRRTRPLMVCEITYGQPLSFTSIEDLQQHLPEDYALYCFDKRKADGSKDRRRDARSRSSGEYHLQALTRFLPTGQDDVIACPKEKLAQLPLSFPA
ncbi:MAG: FkbM family methyltransferase [Pseudomonadales bacterium]|nr:FkbM family methyltransferase [Pseudomonadales bacterium]MCP5357458.1 FkbM family methyltransferase [Pseudomonadales bacterium]